MWTDKTLKNMLFFSSTNFQLKKCFVYKVEAGPPKSQFVIILLNRGKRYGKTKTKPQVSSLRNIMLTTITGATSNLAHTSTNLTQLRKIKRESFICHWKLVWSLICHWKLALPLYVIDPNLYAIDPNLHTLSCHSRQLTVNSQEKKTYLPFWVYCMPNNSERANMSFLLES